MPKAIILLSGGLDSCVSAAIAGSQGYELFPLSVHYGQRHDREQMAAAKVAAFFGRRLAVIKVEGFAHLLKGSSALIDRSIDLPSNRTDDEMGEGAAPSYVPGRNTMLLAIAQSYAEAIEADVIFTGVNHLDYSGYADCRPEFIAAWNELAQVATFRGVDGAPIWVDAPLMEMDKVAIVKKGLELRAPLHLTWSCYTGGDVPCDTCDSCIIRNKAFATVGMTDPSRQII